MPIQERTVMDGRMAFVERAQQPGCNFSALCREFELSRPSGYKLVRRAAAGESLADRSRRPHASPTKTSDAMEGLVVDARQQHPSWGSRKLRRWLIDQGMVGVPAPSTITAILERHGQLPDQAERVHPFQAFAAEQPHDLWQIDFKGPIRIGAALYYPLTVIDDHSRYLIGLTLCVNQSEAVVRTVLREHFQAEGLPRRMLSDNGPPWGSTHPTQPWTALNFWWLRQGIAVSHGRPYHPQTQGKVERVHRTIGRELLHGQSWDDLASAQQAWEQWRRQYNEERPHEALGLATPASHYRPSDRAFVDPLPPIAYEPTDRVMRVHGRGQIVVEGRELFLTGALVRERVALRPTALAGVEEIYYCHHRLGRLDRRGPAATWRIERTDGRGVNHVSV